VRDHLLDTSDHTLVMGVVNVTPDSFSDGGAFVGASGTDHEAAVAHGLVLRAQGADIVDVGGESTRPGAAPVSVDEEISRVVPVVAGLVAADVTVSIDTSKPSVAAAALAVGAHVVNDVTALRDPAMARVCAQSAAGVVLMHMQGSPATMQSNPTYGDVVADVAEYLVQRAEAAMAEGVAPDRICIDPGIGFGKTLDHNLELLARLGELVNCGLPVLVGTSRKRFLGSVLARAGIDTEAGERDTATGATVALAVAAGAAVVRVHDVTSAVQSARIADAIVRKLLTSRKEHLGRS
jgi:dihydropteroate synthase